MFSESNKYITGNIVTSYTFLGSGRWVFRSQCPHGTTVVSYSYLNRGQVALRSKCSLNRLHTPLGSLWPLTPILKVVHWFADQNVPLNRLSTPQGTLWPHTHVLVVEAWFSNPELFPEPTTYTTGNIVESYAVLGSSDVSLERNGARPSATDARLVV